MVGADGRYDLWLPAGGFEIVARATLHPSHVLEVPDGRPDVELDFRLERLSTLTGLVLGPAASASSAARARPA